MLRLVHGVVVLGVAWHRAAKHQELAGYPALIVEVMVNLWQGRAPLRGRLALRTRVRHASNTCGMRASRPGQTLESDARLAG